MVNCGSGRASWPVLGHSHHSATFSRPVGSALQASCNSDCTEWLFGWILQNQCSFPKPYTFLEKNRKENWDTQKTKPSLVGGRVWLTLPENDVYHLISWKCLLKSIFAMVNQGLKFQWEQTVEVFDLSDGSILEVLQLMYWFLLIMGDTCGRLDILLWISGPRGRWTIKHIVKKILSE